VRRAWAALTPVSPRVSPKPATPAWVAIEIAEDVDAAIAQGRILECVPARNTSARSSS